MNPKGIVTDYLRNDEPLLQQNIKEFCEDKTSYDVIKPTSKTSRPILGCKWPNMTHDAIVNDNTRNKYWSQKVKLCPFCKKNGETQSFYSGHNLKDGYGTVQCPVLRNHKCEICGETGDNAHTKAYCKKQPIGQKPVSNVVQSTKRNSTGLRNKSRYTTKISKSTNLK